MNSKPLFSLLAGASFIAMAPVSQAELFNLQATEDTFLASDAPDANFGPDALLQMEGWVSLGARRPLLKFDLSVIPDGFIFVSAQLILEQMGPADWSSFPAEAWLLANDNWGEGTATWNSYDQSSALEVCTLQAPQDPGARVFDIRLADWNYGADLLDNTVTFQTRWGGELSQQYKRLVYSSKEGDFMPILSIEATPEPAGLLALGVGLIALIKRNRR